jgi:hypothetical protein
LREYDDKFNLNWCEIEFKELTIKPVYLWSASCLSLSKICGK